MCRWFVYASAEEECLLEDVLITPTHGLMKMVNDHYLPGLIHQNPEDSQEDKEAAARNIVLNVDGLGLAWYTCSRSDFERDCAGDRPALYKSISPPLNDFNFRNLSANLSTKILFAHIRATSGTAVTPVNCHPFVFGRHTFMHNGGISGFLDIRRQLSGHLDKDTFANVIGSTDSEHLAALYMTILTHGKGKAAWEEEYSIGDMLKALCKAVGIVIDLQKEISGKDARPNSLNLAVTDGSRFLFFRFRNHKTQQPPSLYWSTTAGQKLNRKYEGSFDGSENAFATKKAEEHGKHIIVASEPTTYDKSDWNLIAKNCYIAVEKGGHVVHSPIPYLDDWNVDDDTFVSS